MNEQHSNGQSSFELPQPVETHLDPQEGQGVDGKNESTSAKALEVGSSQPSVNPYHPAGLPDPQIGSTTRVAQPPASAVSPVIDPALIADDTDLIEKEWVNKAKAIVERTKADPHTQNKEMTKIKADYLKKRYNKDIKLPED